MSDGQSMTERFLEFPRAVRWLAFAAIFVVAFRAWDATLGEISRGWSGEADKIEEQVLRVRNSEELISELEEMEDTIVGIGTVEKPGLQNDGRAALTSAVVDVLENEPHKITTYEFDLSGGGERLPEDLSRPIVRDGYRIRRLACSVTFETTPQKAVAIIADLEAREEIEAVRKVTIVKVDSHSKETVEVDLDLESWVEVASAKKGR